MKTGYCRYKLQERRAQILLPAVLLAPIFILVIYLLFETAKVSMAKVRNQFALDNAAYSQMSSASTYLNAVAMVNGPLPYRVMRQYGTGEGMWLTKKGTDNEKGISVFELFFKGGAVPTLGDATGDGLNPNPKAESVDWQVKYYEPDPQEEEKGVVISRKEWEKENPASVLDKKVRIINKELVKEHYFPALDDIGLPAITQYLSIYAHEGGIYRDQDYVYKELSKNAIMFREAYYLNVSDCKKSECGRESAAQLRPFLNLRTKPFELNEIEIFFSDSSRSGMHGGAQPVPLKVQDLFKGGNLFQFAYLDPSSRSKLHALQRGVLLKQNFKLPRNHFNINLEQKYKPYVRNKVTLACPRSSNNCVWPNPLPKYSVSLEP